MSTAFTSPARCKVGLQPSTCARLPPSRCQAAAARGSMGPSPRWRDRGGPQRAPTGWCPTHGADARVKITTRARLTYSAADSDSIARGCGSGSRGPERHGRFYQAGGASWSVASTITAPACGQQSLWRCALAMPIARAGLHDGISRSESVLERMTRPRLAPADSMAVCVGERGPSECASTSASPRGERLHVSSSAAQRSTSRRRTRPDHVRRSAAEHGGADATASLPRRRRCPSTSRPISRRPRAGRPAAPATARIVGRDLSVSASAEIASPRRRS